MIVSFIAVSRYLIQNNCRSVQMQRNISVAHFVKFKTPVLLGFKCAPSVKNVLPFGKYFDKIIHETFPKFNRCPLIVVIAKELKQTPKLIRDNSLCVLKSCIAQFEYVLAYRIRRGQQLISLYTKLWDETALKHFIQQIRRIAYRRSKEFLLGGVTLAFDWKSNSISEDDLKSHANELELCRNLRDRIDHENVCLCEAKDTCPNLKNQEENDGVNWRPFIKQTDLIVWKKEEGNHEGLYSYKMYGKYLDVTATDFLSVFLDIDNRTKWDDHVVQLKVIDSEPSTNSDIIYWETKWPKLFSNRDYVFSRRYIIDETEKVIVVVNRSVVHPDYPVLQSKSRVTEYWSYMVIKPTSEFNQPGIEFSLTYFDNPGISVPSAISLWVSSTGMPEYVKRLRIEALKVSEERQKNEAIAIAEGQERDEMVTKEKVKSKEREPPTRGGGGNELDASVQPPKEKSYEAFLLWASFIEKFRAKA